MRALFLVALFLNASLLMCAQTAHAWWCVGHMTTSYIAQTQMRPSTVAYVQSVVQSLAAIGPFPANPDMTQVACWPDDLKSPVQLHMMDGWHFIDQPYAANGWTLAPGQGQLQDENVGHVMTQLYKGISANKGNPKGWAMGMAIANLIHFFGDVHQPLHAVSMYDAEYPNGDAGGNGEIVFVPNQGANTDGATQTNLHAIWDSICWKWNDDLQRPMSSDNITKLENYGDYLVANYKSKFTAEQISVHDPTVMAAESLELAKTVSYDGIANNTIITQAYLSNCMPVAEGRVTLGGLRLGNQLEYLLGSFAEEWYSNQQREKKQAEENEKKHVPQHGGHSEEHLFNRTIETLVLLKKRFRHGVKAHAEKLKELRK